MYDINEEDINSILNSIRVNDDGTVEVVNISEYQEDTTPEIPQEEIYIGDIPSEEPQNNQTSETQEDNVMSEINEPLESVESNMENPNADLYQLSNIDIDETTARFSGAVWFEEIQKTDILLAGVGGIGSYVVFLLSRMKPNSITIFDNDVVEEVNMAGQLYSLSDIGIGKVNAMSRMVTNYSGYYDLNIKKELFTKSSEYEDIMICGFDNMKARKVFFKRWLTNLNNTNEDKKKDCLFIDGRIKCLITSLYK